MSSSLKPTITEDGEIINEIKECEYAFPQQEKITESIGLNKRTITNSIDTMIKKGFIKIEFDSFAPKVKIDDKVKLKDCYRYYIKLLEKNEYKYHYIIKLEDKENEKEAKTIGIKKYIKNNINTNPKLITNKLYLYIELFIYSVQKSAQKVQIAIKIKSEI